MKESFIRLLRYIHSLRAITQLLGIKVCVFKILSRCKVISSTAYCVLFKKRLIARFPELVSPISKNCRSTTAPEKSNYVWTMWWQGVTDDTPLTVRLCIKSMKANSGNRKVIVITKDNFQDFISIPNVMLSKLTQGHMTLTALSDYMRFKLLNTFGGLWLDSTIFLSRELNEREIQHQPLFTINKGIGNSNGCKTHWTGYCIGGRSEHPLFDKMVKFYDEYWEVARCNVEYFLIDYVVSILYENDPTIRESIDCVDRNNSAVHQLNDAFKNGIYNSYLISCNDTYIFKLSYKEHYPRTSNGRQTTLYDSILKQYNI